MQRNTYKNRILELRTLDLSYQSSDSKALPEPPSERSSRETEQLSIVDDDEEEMRAGAHDRTPSDERQDQILSSIPNDKRSDAAPYIPPRRQSLKPFGTRMTSSDYGSQESSFGYYHTQGLGTGDMESVLPDGLYLPLYDNDMPAPLSPRRPLTPSTDANQPNGEDEADQNDSTRKNEAEHTSWLNTINESSGSEASSVHSRRSSAGLRRRHIRAMRESGQTEAEFNAALDAAVEAAYDDGFEPDDEDEGDEQLINDPEYHTEEPEPLSAVMRDVELAKEKAREAEREYSISQAKERERRRLQEINATRDSIDMEYDDDDPDEEERLLEEMTKDYILDDIEDDGQRKTALPPPRQSGSSGFSGRTWISSNGSNPTSTGTSLTTVAETSIMPSLASKLEDNIFPAQAYPPPASALPPPPIPVTASGSQTNGGAPRPSSLAIRNSSPGVRDRRLSGMKATQLKIETNHRLRSGPEVDAPQTQQPTAPAPLAPSELVLDPPKSAFLASDAPHVIVDKSLTASPSGLASSEAIGIARKDSSPLLPGPEAESVSAVAAVLTKVTSADSDTSVPSVPSSPARFAGKPITGLRKNFSSSSLRNKSLNASEGQDASPNTSISSASSMPKQREEPSPAVPVVPTPLETSFLPKAQPAGGIYLFDCDIHSPTSPGSPNPASTNPPLALEPCPESPLLRPFWLLRSIYQTIAHPRGGYVTSRLFVPRDIWRVKNIKLKNVEEKVSSCDLLTAALLKLGKVDTYNADAVHEEMQFLDGVMDQVQTSLSKKLGNDVGVQGAASLFKTLSTVDDSASNSEALTTKSTASSGKSYLNSWRKLRSKNSIGPNIGPVISHAGIKDGSKDAPTIKSVPMTAVPNPRFPRRDVSQVQCMGPNPSYMGALARLCDAAQILGMNLPSFPMKILCSRNFDADHIHHRPNRASSRRSGSEAFLADLRWTGAQHTARSRVLRLLHLPLCLRRHRTHA